MVSESVSVNTLQMQWFQRTRHAQGLADLRRNVLPCSQFSLKHFKYKHVSARELPNATNTMVSTSAACRESFNRKRELKDCSSRFIFGAAQRPYTLKHYGCNGFSAREFPNATHTMVSAPAGFPPVHIPLFYERLVTRCERPRRVRLTEQNQKHDFFINCENCC